MIETPIAKRRHQFGCLLAVGTPAANAATWAAHVDHLRAETRGLFVRAPATRTGSSGGASTRRVTTRLADARRRNQRYRTGKALVVIRVRPLRCPFITSPRIQSPLFGLHVLCVLLRRTTAIILLMPIAIFESDTISRNRRPKLEAAVVATGGNPQTSSRAAVGTADRRKLAVRITSCP